MKDKSQVIERLRIGLLLRDSSGRLTYEVDKFPCEFYSSIKKELSVHFKLQPQRPTIEGLDVYFQTFTSGLNHIGIEWDNWSGLTVVAENKRAEPLIRKIGDYLEQRFCEIND
ncbi:MAG: hypothetical protein HRT35_28280 [Algicola sp.]|nr:hypothetical protein [Algicola sp.]